MKTPTVDDPKPKRDNLGPTGPAKVSGGENNKTESKEAGGDGSYENDLEHILDRKRAQTPSD